MFHSKTFHIFDEDYGDYTGDPADPRTPDYDEPMNRPELIKALASMGAYQLIEFCVDYGIEDDATVNDSYDKELLREKIIKAFDNGEIQ